MALPPPPVLLAVLPQQLPLLLSLLLLGAGLTTTPVTASRTTVSLDLGWRTAAAAPASACDYPIAVPGGWGMGNSGWSVDAATADACEQAACAHNVQAYSWCEAGHCGQSTNGIPDRAGPGPFCIIGSAGRYYPNQGNESWTSQLREQSASKGADPATTEAARGFDDSSWTVVDLPHDASVELAHSADSDGPEGFQLPTQTFYRKHFHLPAEWQGQAITLWVDGALTASSWWVNGVQLVNLKTDGYLPLILRLDDQPDLKLSYGDDASDDGNIIAVWTDNSATTGWWYEGSGLVRNARLVATPAKVSLQPAFAVAAPSAVVGAVSKNGGTLVEGLSAAATVNPSADISVSASVGGLDSGAGAVTAAAGSATTQKITLTFELYEPGGSDPVATSTVTKTVSDGETVEAPQMTIAKAELWSVARPFLYTLVATLRPGVGGNAHPAEVDSVNSTLGIRELVWNAADGLHVNGQNVKLRGFCNHESFAGVGAAIPPRVDLLRVQQMRGVGGNAWRTSHNPPEPALLELTDRLGIVVLDENRVLTTVQNCPADEEGNPSGHCNAVPLYFGDIPAETGKLALRDRMHASVGWYSLCNEGGCTDGTLLRNDTAKQCQQAIHAVDKSRAITGNQAWNGKNAVAPNTPIADMYDVMGMSHQQTAKLDIWHAGEPNKLVVMTECCSCETQRGEDADLLSTRNASYIYASNEAAACMGQKVAISDNVTWVGGTHSWTLHDYYGEPGENNKWPHVSSSFGSYDLAGFDKAAAWWYRAWWLGGISLDDAGRPPLPHPQTAVFCHLAESWQNSSNGTRTLNVYTNAPYARVRVNGFVPSTGAAVAVDEYGSARFTTVPFAEGNVTAEAISTEDSEAEALASSTARSWGEPVAVVLSLDAPSVTTGTGSAVHMDGSDVALIRATIVDANGVVVHNSSANVTFSVTDDGPARIVGVGNGDPADHTPAHASWKPCYHGLARAIVQVKVKATGDDASRALEALVNPEAGAGPLSSKIFVGDVNVQDGIDIGIVPASFTVVASVEGLKAGSLTVPLSVDANDSVLSVAAASVGLADIGGEK